MLQGSCIIPARSGGAGYEELLPNSPRWVPCVEGRSLVGRGGTATWKTVDVNHLAGRSVGCRGRGGSRRGKEAMVGRQMGGVGLGWPAQGPYLPDCCSPDAFTATAWPIQPR